MPIARTQLSPLWYVKQSEGPRALLTRAIRGQPLRGDLNGGKTRRSVVVRDISVAREPLEVTGTGCSGTRALRLRSCALQLRAMLQNRFALGQAKAKAMRTRVAVLYADAS
jgi:hypothetical protein